MVAKSHVDMSMYIQILEVNDEDIPEELKPAIRTRDIRNIRDSLLSLYKDKGVREVFVDEETNLHESIHLVQAVIYPFLRWHSMISFYHVIETFLDLPKIREVLQGIESTGFVTPVFTRLEAEYVAAEQQRYFLFWRRPPRLLFYNGADVTHSDTTSDPSRFKFNTIELLEDARLFFSTR
jgi:hypothetical protein